MTEFARMIRPFERHHIRTYDLFRGVPQGTVELTSNAPNNRHPIRITPVLQILLKCRFSLLRYTVQDLLSKYCLTIRYIVFCAQVMHDNLMSGN